MKKSNNTLGDGQSVEYVESVSDLENRIRAHKLFSRTSLENVLMRCIEQVNENSALLDLGCGAGNFFKLFYSKARTYVGVDISENLLEDFRRQHNETIVLIKSSMDELPIFQNSSFDAIFSIYSIYYSLRPVELVRSLHNLLSDVGHLFVIGPSKIEHAVEITQFCNILSTVGLKTEKNERIENFHDKIIPQITKTFQSVDIEEIDGSLYFPNPQEWARYVVSTPQVKETSSLDSDNLLSLAIDYSVSNNCLSVSKYMTALIAGKQ